MSLLVANFLTSMARPRYSVNFVLSSSHHHIVVLSLIVALVVALVVDGRRRRRRCCRRRRRSCHRRRCHLRFVNATLAKSESGSLASAAPSSASASEASSSASGSSNISIRMITQVAIEKGMLSKECGSNKEECHGSRVCSRARVHGQHPHDDPRDMRNATGHGLVCTVRASTKNGLKMLRPNATPLRQVA